MNQLNEKYFETKKTHNRGLKNLVGFYGLVYF